MTKNYPVPTEAAQCEIEIKKSRFIARVTSVISRDEAMTFLDQAKSDYPDARHHCWAYIIGNPMSTCTAAMNDDGEPGGTAGKPILNVIQHKGVGDVMVVVIRYFGGIKLGAGGLTRAYSAATDAVFSCTHIEQQQPVIQIRLSCDFAQEQSIRHWAGQYSAQVAQPVYTQGVEIMLTLPEENRSALISFCDANGIKYVAP
jgi:uncharacterized YigZ family protein